ncbi:hypothetical protein [Chryseobacterium vrystaatense]|uniref:hypothetical protein n=1 Tax=Chryseobacterium vrystaatense TaxID=307480 RepID=UPI00068B8DCE|nr:hypothetical protein [Chryseobacterium vrystaatense]
MSKFLPQKRKLLEDVYEKASNATPETAFSAILKSLEKDLLDDFKIFLSYKTFETYYKTIVEKDEDYNIKLTILNDLSCYVGYDSFRDYCLDWKTIEYTVSQTLSKIVINITNKPIFTMPEFMKQNGLGVFGFIFIALLVTGGIVFSGDKKRVHENSGLSFFMNTETSKECMYWNKREYKLIECTDKNPHRNLVPADSIRLKHFKKITRKDTLTVDNALGVTWYSKFYGNVEFFTMDGKDPDNGRELRASTPYIIEKYAGISKE